MAEDRADDHGDGYAGRRPLTTFNKWLVEERRARGWTQDELAKRAGIDQSEVSKWERGTLQLPSTERARRFAVAFNLPYETVWRVVGGIWPDEKTMPDVVKEQERVIPEFVRLLNLRPSPAEATLLSDLLLTHRRWEEGEYSTGRQEPPVEDTP